MLQEKKFMGFQRLDIGGVKVSHEHMEAGKAFQNKEILVVFLIYLITSFF